MDWVRHPVTSDESDLTANAFAKILAFYSGMPSVSERFESELSKQALRQAVSTIVLNAWDGYLCDRPILVEQNDESTVFAEQLRVEWSFLSDTVYALGVVGVLSIQSLNRPETPNHPDYLVSAGEALADKLDVLKAAVLDHSQPLDVHTWSEHPETGAFVDHIYDAYFGTGNVAIRKRHIKVLLLDLYVRWTIDPSLKTGFSRNVNSYDPGSRYNALHISKLMPQIADRLEDISGKMENSAAAA